MSERVTCDKCKSTTNVSEKNGRRVYATHGTYTLGARKPFKPCSYSGLPLDPFDGFREKEESR